MVGLHLFILTGIGIKGIHLHLNHSFYWNKLYIQSIYLPRLAQHLELLNMHAHIDNVAWIHWLSQTLLTRTIVTGRAFPFTSVLVLVGQPIKTYPLSYEVIR